MEHDINEVNKVRLIRARKERDLAYTERNKMLVALCKMAIKLGCVAGIGSHEGEEWEDDWRHIVFIDLPTGQASWHIHDSEKDNFSFLSEYYGKWDGHTTDEKWDRVINAFDVELVPLNIYPPPFWNQYDDYVKAGGIHNYPDWCYIKQMEIQKAT